MKRHAKQLSISLPFTFSLFPFTFFPFPFSLFLFPFSFFLFPFLAAWSEETTIEPPIVMRGPQVEITPREGKPYVCILLSMKEGVLECQLQNGESKRQKTIDAQNLRFLPIDNMEESFSETQYENDLEHYNRLARKDQESELSKIEVDEFFKLRERLPLQLQYRRFKGIGPHKGAAPLEAAQHEKSKGRLDRYISLLQGKLKRAKTMETVRIAASMLIPAYHQKGCLPLEIRSKLLGDISAIEDARLRENVPAKLIDILSAERGGVKKDFHEKERSKN